MLCEPKLHFVLGIVHGYLYNHRPQENCTCAPGFWYLGDCLREDCVQHDCTCQLQSHIPFTTARELDVGWPDMERAWGIAGPTAWMIGRRPKSLAESSQPTFSTERYNTFSLVGSHDVCPDVIFIVNCIVWKIMIHMSTRNISFAARHLVDELWSYCCSDPSMRHKPSGRHPQMYCGYLTLFSTLLVLQVCSCYIFAGIPHDHRHAFPGSPRKRQRAKGDPFYLEHRCTRSQPQWKYSLRRL